jgi:hypothetical protein
LKTRKPFSRARKRLREIERIISRRHHGAVPETDDADVYLEPVVNCFHVIVAGRNRSAETTRRASSAFEATRLSLQRSIGTEAWPHRSAPPAAAVKTSA